MPKRPVKSDEKFKPGTADLSLAKVQLLKNGKPKSTQANIVIESIGVYLPPNAVSTADVVAGCQNKIAFPLEDMTGIKSRRVSANDEFTSDIAGQGGRRMSEEFEICVRSNRFNHLLPYWTRRKTKLRRD